MVERQKRADETDEKALRDNTRNSNSQLLLYTALGHSFSLENWCDGKHIFLVCGGPSFKALDAAQLHKPGVVTFAVNNAAYVYRPNYWLVVDTPGNFIDTIWKDPSIIKFAPPAHLSKNLHVKKLDGAFRKSKYTCADCPAVFYYKRNEFFNPNTFFTENTVNWGNHGRETDELGIKGSRSVMLAALRMIVYMGFKHIYLLGADFKMTQDNGDANYAWKQSRSQSSVRGNNTTYAALNKRFTALLPELKKRGVGVHNCNPDSELTSFPFIDYDEAIKRATKECSKEVDTDGWYDHQKQLK